MVEVPPSAEGMAMPSEAAARLRSMPVQQGFITIQELLLEIIQTLLQNLITAENLPNWHSATTTCQIATPHAMDRNIPPQLVVFV